ncbi:tetratricopeptide repeat domain-containing protein, partial [Clathrospora elynae]
MRRLLDFRSKKSKTKVRTPRDPSVSSASAEPAGAVAQGLQVLLSGELPVPVRPCLNAGVRPMLGEADYTGRRLKAKQTAKRPIIFVAHSLGGIIVKSALIHSDAARRGALEEHRSIKLSTYGVMFMGTPHQGGSGVALGKLMVNIASVFVAADNRLLQHLERDSEWLQQQLGQYGPISGDFVVPRASAVVPGAVNGEPIAIHADHINMVKFGSKSDPGYKTVSGHMRLMAGNAGDTIGGRWDTEAKVNAVHSNEPIKTFTVQSSVSEVLRVQHFVGREDDIVKICEALQYDGLRKTAVVHGLGGMGKTQLALAYAQRHREEYSAVFWVNIKDVDTLKQGYAAAAKRISRDHPSLVQLRAVAEASDLDEAIEVLPGRNDKGTFDIRPFLPEVDHGTILITTRSSQLELGSPVAVKKLQKIEHSLEILLHTSRRDGLSSDPYARELAETLDGLPLALATACAYLHLLGSFSFAEYLRLYKASWFRLQQDTPQLLSYEDRALYTTWGVSLDHVKKQSELAAKLLQLWAYFDNQDVWFELLQECQQDSPDWFSELMQDQLSFNKAVRVLCDHALVEVDAMLGEKRVESQGYSMHSCVHSWTAHVLNQGCDNKLSGLALKCVGRHVPDTNHHNSLVTKRRLMRHALRSWEFVADGSVVSDGKEHYLHSFGDMFADQGQLDEAEKMYQRALQGYEKAWGREHTSTLKTVN